MASQPMETDDVLPHGHSVLACCRTELLLQGPTLRPAPGDCGVAFDALVTLTQG